MSKIKKLNKEIAEIEQYRNDYKYAKEHGFLPKIKYPNWMKQSKRLQLLISKEKFNNDDGK